MGLSMAAGIRRRVFAVFTLTIIGCTEPGEIRDYDVEPENDRELTSEVLRDQFPHVPFRWDIPDTWRIAANDQFSLRAWTAGPPASAARITLGKFPAASGISAQVRRWRRQVDLETTDDEAAMKDVKSIDTRNRSGSWISLDGKRDAIRALILQIESDFWILKYRSSLETAKLEAKAFRSFCDSFEYSPIHSSMLK